MNTLEQLKQYTTVVADTGDFQLMRQYLPQDATTNPSLILKAAQKADYAPLLKRVVDVQRGQTMAQVIDAILVAFGLEILQIVPGRVSTEIDARLSFDTVATIARGRSLITQYEAHGISRDRILIKIAATWEGIQAARALQAEGIRCNMTLLFSMVQAVACAQANVQLISPFVGRILDWYKKNTGQEYTPQTDPGVLSVQRIYAYYKQHGHRTEVMGASFRNIGEILELAGCDLLTISPDLLGQLQASEQPVTCKLGVQSLHANASEPAVTFDEASFRYALNEDAMATEKLAEGIRLFALDTLKLEQLIASIT